MKTPRSLARFDAFRHDYFTRLQHHPSCQPEFLYYARQQLQRIVDAGALCLRVPERSLEDILKSGRIKEVVECGGGTTMGGAETRKEVVKALFNAETEKMAPREFPKFGYLGPVKARQDFFGNPDMAYQYGNVRFVLKRDTVAANTTLTVGDSVNFGACYYMVPTRITDILPTCFIGLPNRDDIREGIKALHRQTADPLLRLKVFCSLCFDRKLTPENFVQFAEIAQDMPGMEFFELQYHGELSLDQDVEAIEIMDWTDDTPEICRKLQPLAKKHNLELKLVSMGI